MPQTGRCGVQLGIRLDHIVRGPPVGNLIGAMPHTRYALGWAVVLKNCGEDRRGHKTGANKA